MAGRAADYFVVVVVVRSLFFFSRFIEVAVPAESGFSH